MKEIVNHRSRTILKLDEIDYKKIDTNSTDNEVSQYSKKEVENKITNINLEMVNQWGKFEKYRQMSLQHSLKSFTKHQLELETDRLKCINDFLLEIM